jgi:S-DNA-T family DNA segregation ATPase FtsK/SpoIIIE
VTTTSDVINEVVKHGPQVHPIPPEDLVHEPGTGTLDVVDLTDRTIRRQASGPVEGTVLPKPQQSPTVAPWERDYSHRQSVLPPWLRSWDDARRMFRHWRGEARYWTGVAALRFYPKLIMYSPRGAYRVLRTYWTWQFYMESRQMRLDASAENDKVHWKTLEGLRRQEVKKRAAITAVLVGLWLAFTLIANVALLIWGGMGAVMVTAKAIGAIGVLTVFVLPIPLGLAGRPTDKPMVRLPVKPQGPFVLCLDLIQSAFVAAKLASDKNPTIPVDEPHRDGPGWRARIKLPEGISATKAIEKREELASGFDVLADQLFLKSQRGQSSGSQRALELWIADVVPSTIPAGVTPLLDVNRLDFWKPFPIGVNERGSPVLLTLLWLSVIIAGLPRMGKTFVGRMFCLAAALDPHVRLNVFDFKPSADWKPLRLVAHEFHAGVTRDMDTGLHPVQQLNRVCEELEAEIERRGHVLRSLPYGMCPEGKITPEITHSPTLRMPLLLTIIDEFHVPIQDDTYGEELGKRLANIVKTGPAVGAITVTMTQKPGGLKGEAGRLYAQIRDSSAARMVLRCPNKQVSNLATGDTDLDASALPQTAKGAILVNGAEAEVEVKDGLVRTYLADSVHADEICKRARTLREKVGTLSGMALGIKPDQDPTEARNLASDILAVMAGEDQMHSDKLASRLATEWPSSYPGWDQGTVGVRAITLGLKAWDVTPGDTWDADPLVPGTSPNKTGVKRDDLLRALAGAAAADEARAALSVPPPTAVPDDPPAGDDASVDVELVVEAATLAVTIGYVSTAMLQRKMRVGRGQAESILDRLRLAGVCEADGPGTSREVLIEADDLAATILMIRGST